MPVFNTPPDVFEAAVGSLQAQTYEHWELCLADDGSTSSQFGSILRSVTADPRVRAVSLAANSGIVAATNAALALARGEYVAFMDHDDLLARDALGAMATAIGQHPSADLFFSDEDQIVTGRHAAPYFKPGWNPDLLLGQNMVGHLAVFRRSLVERLGGMREEFAGSQDYDLALRASAVASEVRHVPRVLYHWRQGVSSFSATHAELCRVRARRAVAGHLGGMAEIIEHPMLPQWNRVVFPVPDPAPRVSVIVLGEGSAPHDAEYRAVDVVRAVDASFDEAAGLNEILLFVSADLRPATDGWLRELVSQVLRPGIGCAGARLDGPDGRIVHAGYMLDPAGVAQSLAPGSDADDPGYRGQFMLMRNVAAVSEHCLCVRRDVFLAAGGFDAAAGAWRAVDLCLRLAEKGLRSVWTPHARLAYATSPAPVSDARGAAVMRARWGHMLAADPYANPNLTVRRGTFALAADNKVFS